ncbi:MAG: hypothetical protein ACI9G1_003358 [Pirellulaceae bacterium]|jgi:hypothetical protein
MKNTALQPVLLVAAAVALCGLPRAADGQYAPRESTTANSAAASPQLAPRQGVVVLRNGRVISGAVTRLGDRYLVTLGESGEVRLPIEQVEMVCDSITEAYLKKRASTRTLDADDHLNLAQWCFNQAREDRTMVAAAADEILSAMSKDKDNPRIPQLERRLSMMSQAQAPTPVIVSEPTSFVDKNAIDRELRALTPAATKAFSTTIQPILFNRCANPACHGVQAKNDFRLVRLTIGKTPTLRITRRNLYLALKQVDRDNPEASPLLDYATRAHGTMATSVVGPHEKGIIEILQAWAKETRPILAAAEAPAQVTQAKQNLAKTYLKTVPETPGKTEPAADAEPKVAGKTSFAPKDPFDAEVFNRRFFKR